MSYLYTVTSDDVGYGRILTANGRKYWTTNAFGPFQAIDVGKRVYVVDGVLQMESNDQLAKRQEKP